MNSVFMASDKEKSKFSDVSRGMAALLRSLWVFDAYMVGVEESPKETRDERTGIENWRLE